MVPETEGNMLKEYATLDATALAALVTAGEVAIDEVIDTAITHIERLNPLLNAVVTPMFDQAKESLSGTPTGPFHGVPFLIKDLSLAWAGARLTNGSRFTKDLVADQTAPLAEAFKRAGLVTLGKTNTPEWGITGTTESALFGPCRNPWQREHIAGGSSGGAAAAVAAGLVPMAHASDGAGSIRIPAACCGLVGLMPSRRRQASAGRAFDVPFAFSRHFAVTRSVRDSARLLDVVRQRSPYGPPDPADTFSATLATPGPRLRIAASATKVSRQPIDATIEHAWRDTTKLLESLGHQVEDRHLDAVDMDFYRAFGTISSAQLAADLDRHVDAVGREPAAEEMEPLSWRNIKAGYKRSGTEIIEALRHIEAFTRRVSTFFDDIDIYLTPVLGTPVPKLGFLDPVTVEPREHDKRSGRIFPFTPPFNATGQPAISLPLGMDPDGLPIGMQLVGRYGADATLLNLAAELEAARPWAHRRPGIFADE
jgi:amidase